MREERSVAEVGGRGEAEKLKGKKLKEKFKRGAKIVDI